MRPSSVRASMSAGTSSSARRQGRSPDRAARCLRSTAQAAPLAHAAPHLLLAGWQSWHGRHCAKPCHVQCGGRVAKRARNVQSYEAACRCSCHSQWPVAIVVSHLRGRAEQRAGFRMLQQQAGWRPGARPSAAESNCLEDRVGPARMHRSTGRASAAKQLLWQGRGGPKRLTGGKGRAGEGRGEARDCPPTHLHICSRVDQHSHRLGQPAFHRQVLPHDGGRGATSLIEYARCEPY